MRARAPREAEAKVLAERQERYREIEKEKAEAAARRAREQAEEQAIREDLIRQIRALERVPKVRAGRYVVFGMCYVMGGIGFMVYGVGVCMVCQHWVNH